MSWMDSWSRPSKHQATPPPLYLLPGGEETPYCRSCGRVISSRKATATSKSSTPVKYCSTRCRNNKPGKIDRQIEDSFVSLLNGSNNESALLGADNFMSSKNEKNRRRPKGETRALVSCSIVEALTFGTRQDSDEVNGRRRGKRGVADEGEWKTVDMEDELPTRGAEKLSESKIDGDVLARMSIRAGTRIRLPQDVSEVNGGVGGEKGWAERIEETEDMLEKRKDGQRRAEEREMVRCAARRGVVFGFVTQQENEPEPRQRRKCEAVMMGKVVEASFAKGEWGIRWRE